MPPQVERAVRGLKEHEAALERKMFLKDAKKRRAAERRAADLAGEHYSLVRQHTSESGSGGTASAEFWTAKTP